jgi:hypothetical protein
MYVRFYRAGAERDLRISMLQRGTECGASWYESRERSRASINDTRRRDGGERTAGGGNILLVLKLTYVGGQIR